MGRPVVGIIGNGHVINDDYPIQGTGNLNLEAVAQVADAVALVVPAIAHLNGLDDLLNVFDGFVFTGGRPNVHPEEYGHEPTAAHGEFDRDRDGLTLPLIRRCVDEGRPVLGICRGFQEMNVAFGGTLHPEIRDLPGRDNHRMPPDGTLEEKFALRHKLTLVPGGVFSRVFGADEVMVNSLHGQGISVPGRRIIVEGWAPDGTPEAIQIADAPGFALGVQWHPEWNANKDPVSRCLFEAFGEALRHHARSADPV